MSKSVTFFSLALLVVASTESKLISSTNTDQESSQDASFFVNPAAPPDNFYCSGLTFKECEKDKYDEGLDN